MKIHLDMTGRKLAQPDFEMLRAGIAAAQATTPTAAANEIAHRQFDLVEALTLLFADRVTGAKEAAALHGSFNPGSVRDDSQDETEK